jgi:hypothetical protein
MMPYDPSPSTSPKPAQLRETPRCDARGDSVSQPQEPVDDGKSVLSWLSDVRRATKRFLCLTSASFMRCLTLSPSRAKQPRTRRLITLHESRRGEGVWWEAPESWPSSPSAQRCACGVLGDLAGSRVVRVLNHRIQHVWTTGRHQDLVSLFARNAAAERFNTIKRSPPTTFITKVDNGGDCLWSLTIKAETRLRAPEPQLLGMDG